MPTSPVRERVSEKSRADLLAEITELPPSAFVTTAQAAAYLGSTPAVMMNWRSQRRGPRYHGKHEFVRYRISDLDLWMSARADEIPEIENLEASKARVSA
jgi:helix-turn-helix protein